jgi:class 3 adenylate cyclase
VLGVVSGAPETRFALTSGGDRVAFQVVGEGPVDVLVTRAPFFPVDLMWDEPRLVHFLTRMSSFCRHIWFDPRGTGASDGVSHSEGRLFETVVEDMVAVIDEVGCDQVVVLQLSGIGAALLFAATHPRRTTALVLLNTAARLRRAADYADGFSDAEVDELLTQMGGTGLTRVELMAPSLAGDAAFRRWFERAARLACSPKEAVWRQRQIFDVDLRAVLPSVQAPALVMYHPTHRSAALFGYVADHLARAVRSEAGSRDPFFPTDSADMLDAIEEFLTGQLPAARTDRVLATLLFTDLVDSTGAASRLGDRRWRQLLATHDALIEAELDRFRGRAIKSTGDGVLATFDGPARAIRCACAVRDAVHALGLKVRAGVHTGEIELREHDIAGIAVHVGQRVASQAGPGEVLVSRTVADLIAGSDIELLDRGEYQLKGVAGAWRLFSVRD